MIKTLHHFLRLSLIVIVLLGAVPARGQVAEHLIAGDVNIAHPGFFHIPGNNTLHIEKKIITTRNSDPALRGMLSFAETAGWHSNNGSFVDGYVRSCKTDAFVFPVGQSTYRPAAISAAAESAPTDVAYYAPALYNTTALGDRLTKVSNESWLIHGTVPAAITLSWTSNIASFVDDLEDLCVVGWSTIYKKWIIVPSVITSSIFGVASNLTEKGSVSTISSIVPNQYAAYALGEKCEIPPAPGLITDTDTLLAFYDMPIDLTAAVDTLAGFTYTFYENPDLTGRITGSVVVFDPLKNDYYVTATIRICESAPTKIILKDPCPKSVEDAEGTIYKVSSLGGHCWTENLKTTKYPGTDDMIPFAVYTCNTCPDDLDAIFGLLYTWYAAVGVETGHALPLPDTVQGICPDGWRIPLQAEWSALYRYDAIALRGAEYWLDPLGTGTDTRGFNALPAGWYNSAINKYQDLYGFAGWWASDALTETIANHFSISYYCNNLQQGEATKSNRLSVRCVRN